MSKYFDRIKNNLCLVFNDFKAIVGVILIFKELHNGKGFFNQELWFGVNCLLPKNQKSGVNSRF